MDNNEIQKKRINEADYIDITVFIRAFLRLARRYLLLVCPIIVCLTICMNLLSRALVKEQYVAEASFVVGVTLLDDYSYNYTLPTIRDDYIVLMSEAFRAVIKSEYMDYLLEEELGESIQGEIYWESAYGTNMGGVYVVSDLRENAEQLRDAVITCLPKALFTTLGDIELKILETSEWTEVLHENLKSPRVWVGAGVIGGILAYFGIIFLMTLWRNDIEGLEDMRKITNLPCLGTLTGSVKTVSNNLLDHKRSSRNEYSRSISEFEKQLAGLIEQQQVKTLLFTGGYKKRGQTELLERMNHDWIRQGKRIQFINMDLSEAMKTGIQIREELNQQIEKASKDADLVIINGPDYEQTVELLTIADCADGIVYIVKEGYDQIENTKEAIITLGFTQAEFMGYVITD